MHWKNLANYDYLGSYSLEGIAKEIILTMKEIKKERVTATGGSSEDCIVCYFDETKVGKIDIKPMVMNRTNCKTIEKLYGPQIEDWIGKKIIVFSTTTQFRRDIVPCLRVKAEIPKAEEYFCQVCGVKISKATHDASIEKYGKAYCSKECLESDKTNQEQKNNKNKGE